MNNVLELNGFSEMNENQMMMIDGGYTWKNVGKAALAGAVVGALSTATPMGAVGGALLGAIGEMIADF